MEEMNEGKRRTRLMEEFDERRKICFITGGGLSEHAATVRQWMNSIFKSTFLELFDSGIYMRNGLIFKSKLLNIAIDSCRALLFDSEQREALEKSTCQTVLDAWKKPESGIGLFGDLMKKLVSISSPSDSIEFVQLEI